jgi:hypothetical protein
MTSTTVLAQAALDNAVVPPLWRLLTKFAYFARVVGAEAAIVMIVASFAANLRLHERIDNLRLVNSER